MSLVIHRLICYRGHVLKGDQKFPYTIFRISSEKNYKSNYYCVLVAVGLSKTVLPMQKSERTYYLDKESELVFNVCNTNDVQGLRSKKL